MSIQYDTPEFKARLEDDREEAKRLSPQEIRDIFREADPTNNKKYVKWLVRGYLSGANVFLEDVAAKADNLLRKFISLVDRGMLSPAKRDINRYKGLNDLYEALKEYPDLVSSKDIHKAGEKEITQVYKDDKITVITPLTKSAAIYHGRGTNWCTSSDSENNPFEDYEESPLYIITTWEGKKYQLHLMTEQFMDANDKPVVYEDIAEWEDSLLALLKIALEDFDWDLFEDTIRDSGMYYTWDLLTEQAMKISMISGYLFKGTLRGTSTYHDLVTWVRNIRRNEVPVDTYFFLDGYKKGYYKDVEKDSPYLERLNIQAIRNNTAQLYRTIGSAQPSDLLKYEKELAPLIAMVYRDNDNIDRYPFSQNYGITSYIMDKYKVDNGMYEKRREFIENPSMQTLVKYGSYFVYNLCCDNSDKNIVLRTFGGLQALVQYFYDARMITTENCTEFAALGNVSEEFYTIHNSR